MTNSTAVPLPVAITMGDPSGVGAEVIVKALAQYDEATRKKIVVIGDRSILDRASKVCGLTVHFHDWKHAGEKVTLSGWVYNKTGKGKLQFIMLRDGTGVIQFYFMDSETSIFPAFFCGILAKSENSDAIADKVSMCSIIVWVNLLSRLLYGTRRMR